MVFVFITYERDSAHWADQNVRSNIMIIIRRRRPDDYCAFCIKIDACMSQPAPNLLVLSTMPNSIPTLFPLLTVRPQLLRDETQSLTALIIESSHSGSAVGEILGRSIGR